jgi:Nitrate reductase delta subunit
MSIFATGPDRGVIDGHRERVYGILAALLSHPDEGKWGRVLNAEEQRRAIGAADAVRSMASSAPYLLLPGELGCEELDLRFLVVELCQPLEHLKGEYERVLCTKRPRAGCSPFAIDHQKPPAGFIQDDFLAGLAGLYRAFDFGDGDRPPRRPDHIAREMEFMNWLISQSRLAGRMAGVDQVAAEQRVRCDLAQHNFFSDHLNGWVGSFATGVQKHTGGGYFEPLARFLAAWISVERHYLDAEPRSRENLGPRKEVPVGT